MSINKRKPNRRKRCRQTFGLGLMPLLGYSFPQINNPLKYIYYFICSFYRFISSGGQWHFTWCGSDLFANKALLFFLFSFIFYFLFFLVSAMSTIFSQHFSNKTYVISFISSNLNPQLKLCFCPLIRTYHLRFIVNVWWKYYGHNISLFFSFFFLVTTYSYPTHYQNNFKCLLA